MRKRSYRKAKDKARNRMKKLMGILGGLTTIIALLIFFTGKNFPDFFQPKQGEEAAAQEYFISLAVSDTISTAFEPAKKIVATASADTKNMVLSVEPDLENHGPYNMTRESDRRYSFLAVFYEAGTYTITITAYGEAESTAQEELVITA